MNRIESISSRLSAWALAFTALAAMTLQAEPPAKGYELLYEDNFDGQELNTNDWRYRLGERTGAYFFNSLNRKENVSVSGGRLHIAARQEMVNGKLVNSGGGIISRHQFGYGYYETRSQPFMGGHGVHSAFWQAGGATSPNDIFEIDGYEIDSKSFMACHNLYIHLSPKEYKEVPWVHRANAPFKLAPDGSYLCGYEYTPEGVVFYEDNQVVAQADWPELTAAQVVLLTALNGTGKVDGQPGETTFDFFRYYARDYPGVNLLPNGSFEYNQDKINPAKPVAWQQQGSAPDETVLVTSGDACRGQYKLRQGHALKPYNITTHQTLEFIRNGNYELSAMVRSSGGQKIAQVRVGNCGGPELSATVPAARQWTRISVPLIPVSNHRVTVAIVSEGAPGQWLEIDDIRFQKPALPGQATSATPFVLIGDPIWKIAMRQPIRFNGDGKFYFFDRCVGCGPAITVDFTMNPDTRANTSPIARLPKTGTAGWSVQLTTQGDIIFRIGSGASHRDILAPGCYAAGRDTHVTCTFAQGTAKIYVDGQLRQSVSGVTFSTTDQTAPGRMGAVNDIYDAVSDVMVRNEHASTDGTKSGRKYRNYVGTLRQVRVYNRSLDQREVAGLSSAQPTPR